MTINVIGKEEEEGVQWVPVVTKYFFREPHALAITTRKAPNETVVNKTLTMFDDTSVSSGKLP